MQQKIKSALSVQFSSVAQSCPTLWDPMNRSTPGLPVHHQLPEFTQTLIHRVSDAIQPSHPLLSPFPPAPNPSQHQSFPMSQLFAWGGQSTGVSALASFLPKKSQGWSPSEWTGWICLQSKSRYRWGDKKKENFPSSMVQSLVSPKWLEGDETIRKTRVNPTPHSRLPSLPLSIILSLKISNSVFLSANLYYSLMWKPDTYVHSILYLF